MAKLSTIARRVVSKNTQLKDVVANAPANGSYKAVEAHISQRFVTKVGRAENTFIQRNALIWAIIDECSEDDEGLDY